MTDPDEDRHLDRAAARRRRNARHQRRITRRRRALVLLAYGGRCQCCGEDRLDLLELDHQLGDGAEHRGFFGLHHGQATYRWIIANDFPPGFQVLCIGCNHLKRRGQHCLCQQLEPLEYEFRDLLQELPPPAVERRASMLLNRRELRDTVRGNPW